MAEEIYVDYVTNEELELTDWVDAKVDMLYDMAILKTSKMGRSEKRDDTRESQVRHLLKRCNSRREMDILLYDVVRGNMSLNELLNRGIKCLRGGN